MQRALLAGLLYFVLVFAAGFALGSARVLVLAPLLGALGAVLLELPVMLAISWLACGYVLRRLPIEPRAAPRLTVGLVAFTLLMAAELLVSTALMGRTMAEHFAHYAGLEALLGLTAQIAFAAFPLLRRG